MDSKEKRPPARAIERVRADILRLIAKDYRTIEKFAYENELNKSTLSKFLNAKRLDVRLSTLEQIAKGLGKKLVVRLE